jgi:ATP-dependent DNA helicase RecG
LKITFEEVSHPNGRVLLFHVPSRHKGQPVHYQGKYLMRAGGELVPMSADQLRDIFAEGDPDWLSRPAWKSCSDDMVVQLLDTQIYFDLRRQPYPVNRVGVLDRFESEKLIERCDPGWTITNLGAILFAKRLEEFDGLARKAPRVIVYEGKSKLNTKTDLPGSKGYAVGFQGLVEFINGLVPSNEVIEQAIRRQVKMFPDIAIRELVANALIHQDFTESGTSVMIELYDDRMEISNPGKPFISPDRFIDEYQSRNERLADLMRRLGICEEKGSGIDKVIQASEAYQLPAPDFRVGELRTTAVLFAHLEIEEMDRNDRIRACYQHCCLRYVMNEQMTNQSLRERFKLPADKSATTSQIISATLDAGKIKLTDVAQAAPRYRSYIPFWA